MLKKFLDSQLQIGVILEGQILAVGNNALSK